MEEETYPSFPSLGPTTWNYLETRHLARPSVLKGTRASWRRHVSTHVQVTGYLEEFQLLDGIVAYFDNALFKLPVAVV